MIEDVSSRSLTLVGIAAIAAGLLGMALVQNNRAITATGEMDAHIHMMGADAGKGVAARPTTTVKPLSCEKLPNVPGRSITTALVEFPPNAYTPQHRHPGSVTAFVIKGALRSQMEGEPAVTYTQSQTWFEPPGAIHSFAENASATEPAELLATFVAEDDCGPLAIPVPD
ncbi:cupin domain-containing protein [Mesorhizobium sp. M2C.T.Ca.TU.002.02.1.1]|uniref:cupin domain-containing protein n=1 Tax=Mesorhizobium sp. M2C.T.Ca.TU.002.02.1.1 TaxID=2496788 RepID=UPI000FCA250B|nr:cupin domain-containing protein [Mesorhizobium sp. M2C.T.Ca.TU.002.02.1.1]RUU53628.1 cupin domain-containing protein [Mesorhizobium sp. M2C.T.Ca.TU.002.02.1.1]RUU64833.1 cupin domain-containing protein [Mesorhizobium sp. M2C.T.Ca.TU.009.01.2.1]